MGQRAVEADRARTTTASEHLAVYVRGCGCAPKSDRAGILSRYQDRRRARDIRKVWKILNTRDGSREASFSVSLRFCADVTWMYTRRTPQIPFFRQYTRHRGSRSVDFPKTRGFNRNNADCLNHFLTSAEKMPTKCCAAKILYYVSSQKKVNLGCGRGKVIALKNIDCSSDARMNV